jgi:hypothetical protein
MAEKELMALRTLVSTSIMEMRIMFFDPHTAIRELFVA